MPPDPPLPMTPALRQGILLAAFTVSGATALAYELAWTRVASTWFGVSAYAISTILAAFFVGLAVGGALGSWWLARHPQRSPLAAYARFELGIGLSALVVQGAIEASEPLMVAIASVLPGMGPISLLVRFGVVGLLLAAPTVCMGATFPLLSQALASGRAAPGRVVALAYGTNALGAALGCGLTVFWALQALGVRRTVLVAVVLNFAVAAVAWTLSRAESNQGPAPEPPLPEGRTGAVLPALVAVSGFVVMATEVVWSRIYPVALGVLNPYRGFALVLTLVLLGMGIGSMVLAWLEARGRGLDGPSRLRWFAGLQGAAALCAVLALADVQARLRAGLGLPIPALRAMAVATLVTPAVLLGTGFPLLSAVYAPRRADLGQRLGGLYAVSTVAGVVGSLAGGFVLVPHLGLRRSLLLLAALGSMAAVLALVLAGAGRRARALALVPALAAGIAGLATWEWPYFDPGGQVLYLHDGLEATTAVVEQRGTGRRILYTNGIPIDGITSASRVLGPAALHPAPERILLVGFGTGLSASTLLDHYPDALVDCVELDGNQAHTTPFFGTEALLEHERFTLHIEDGRQFLLRSPAAYDLVIVDSWGHEINQEFYNVDFFADATGALARDGVFYIKLPAAQLSRPEDVHVLLASVSAGFPMGHVVFGQHVFPGLVGSKAPLRLADQAAKRAGLRAEDVRHIDQTVLGRLPKTRLNTDDRPWFFANEPGPPGRMDPVLAALLAP